MNVLVTGGDGFVGRHLCSELLDRGHDVTSLSRTPDPSVLPDEVDLRQGDVTDYDSIEDAFKGQDVAVNLAALPPLHQPPRETSHDSVCIGGSINAVEAAEQHGVSKFVEMSSLGADPNGDTAYWRTQGLGEKVVRSSELDWIVFRPSFIFGEDSETFTFVRRHTTPYVTVLPNGGDRPQFQPIWIGDCVDIFADGIEDDAYDGEVYELGGPEVLSFGEVTRMLYEADGKSVEILPVPMRVATIALHAVDPIPSIPLGVDQARALKMTNVADHNDVDAFGYDESNLTTLSAYLRGEQRHPSQRRPVSSD
ncbi:complex I NDUFA9 subunit family protein [Natrinema salsiterrestre]|uniref:Complex I NDUFA9 subunit family protein n=1 Tax=Natrinema salsiterrestre TaxID=2950540 RepID=A0A9Q4KXE0_9EURY|nr:complex I NDUFA9 subunit family protein [Natrinema salsiterrestre]MDF9745058.1 complex I NDUFA9 subunit family protein [Natrinema salsiterrestre]